jgi:hypothetical protein
VSGKTMRIFLADERMNVMLELTLGGVFKSWF